MPLLSPAYNSSYKLFYFYIFSYLGFLRELLQGVTAGRPEKKCMLV